jgi:riboflavin synthase
MFTGLVEETSRLISLRRNPTGARLLLHPPSFAGAMSPGDSLALNGCCLTLAEANQGLAFDLLEETLIRTNLGDLPEGSAINLERALRLDARLGGHFVQGHVDATAPVLEVTWKDDDLYLRFALPEGSGAFFVEKGSIAVNGVSLTVATIGSDSFGVWIIPHTRALTNLGQLEVGHRVNLEYDMLAKHVLRFLELRQS